MIIFEYDKEDITLDTIIKRFSEDVVRYLKENLKIEDYLTIRIKHNSFTRPLEIDWFDFVTNTDKKSTERYEYEDGINKSKFGEVIGIYLEIKELEKCLEDLIEELEDELAEYDENEENDEVFNLESKINDAEFLMERIDILKKDINDCWVDEEYILKKGKEILEEGINIC